MKLGFDLDGCVYDFTQGFKLALEYALNHHKSPQDKITLPDLPNPRGWNFYEHWGLDKGQYMDMLDLYAPMIYGNHRLEPMEGAGAAMRAALREGHEVWIVTHRGDENMLARSATASWLDAWGIYYTGLVFSRDKTIVPTDAFIEDRPENYAALEAAGVQAYLVDRPWNQDFEAGNRVSSVAEYVDKALSTVLV